MKTSFLAVVLYHFCFSFILFWHTGHINFDFNWCLVFTECCFQLWKSFESPKSLLRFLPSGNKISPPSSTPYHYLENSVHWEHVHSRKLHFQFPWFTLYFGFAYYKKTNKSNQNSKPVYSEIRTHLHASTKCKLHKWMIDSITFENEWMSP